VALIMACGSLLAAAALLALRVRDADSPSAAPREQRSQDFSLS
jgi:hypothetical protein